MSDYKINGGAVALGDQIAEASSSTTIAQDNDVAGSGVEDLGNDNVDVAGVSGVSDTDVEFSIPGPEIDYSGLKVDIHGRKLEKETPREEFKSQEEYVIYCKAVDSETGKSDDIRVVFGKRTKGLAQKGTPYPRKLLLDASPVLRVAFRDEFYQEGRDGCLYNEHTEPRIFQRLIHTLEIGGSIIRGDEDELTALIKTYELADFYQMEAATKWITDNIKDVIELMQLRWIATARGVAMTAERTGNLPSAEYNLHQQRRLLDISQAYELVMKMKYGMRPIEGSTLLDLALRFCPPQVLQNCLPNLGREFLEHLCRALLQNRIQT